MSWYFTPGTNFFAFGFTVLETTSSRTDKEVTDFIMDLVHSLWEMTSWKKLYLLLLLLLLFQCLLETFLNKFFFP